MSGRRGRWRRAAGAALLVAAAVLGGAPRGAEAQPKWKTGPSREIDPEKLAQAIREKAREANPPDALPLLNHLAAGHDAGGEYAQAASLYQRALALQERALGPNHPEVATALERLARMEHARGAYGQAESSFELA